jgi:hypothetical protein
MKKEPNQQFQRISAPAANENSITYERISLVKFPEKSFSTATLDCVNNLTAAARLW